MANARDKMGNIECDVSHFCVIAVSVPTWKNFKIALQEAF